MSDRFTHRRRRAAVVVVSALMAGLLAAGPVVAETPHSAPLFIASTPYGARVTINGSPLPGTTPMLVKGLEPGVHRLAFSRDGYQDRAVEVVVGDNPPIEVDITLSPHLIGVVTPAGYAAIHPGIVATPSAPMLLPSGDYRVQRAEGSLRIEPIYPRDTRLPVSIETLTAASFAVKRLTGRRGRKIHPPLHLPATVESLFQFAETDGDLAFAAAVHRRLIREHPDSRRVPQSMYRAARIELTRGAYPPAEELFLELVTRYPTPATNDLALRNLADQYEITGRNRDAIEYERRTISTAEAAVLVGTVALVRPGFISVERISQLAVSPGDRLTLRRTHAAGRELVVGTAVVDRVSGGFLDARIERITAESGGTRLLDLAYLTPERLP